MQFSNRFSVLGHDIVKSGYRPSDAPELLEHEIQIIIDGQYRMVLPRDLVQIWFDNSLNESYHTVSSKGQRLFPGLIFRLVEIDYQIESINEATNEVIINTSQGKQLILPIKNVKDMLRHSFEPKESVTDPQTANEMVGTKFKMGDESIWQIKDIDGGQLIYQLYFQTNNTSHTNANKHISKEFFQEMVDNQTFKLV